MSGRVVSVIGNINLSLLDYNFSISMVSTFSYHLKEEIERCNYIYCVCATHSLACLRLFLSSAHDTIFKFLDRIRMKMKMKSSDEGKENFRDLPRRPIVLRNRSEVFSAYGMFD